MGWAGSDPRALSALKTQKLVLERLTPNRSAAAEIVGVHHSSMSRWCAPTCTTHHFPLALASFHPEAVRLLEIHAQQVGYTLVPVGDAARLNPCVTDEILSCLKHLGHASDQVQTALQDGRIDPQEARALVSEARQLQQRVQDLVVEAHRLAGEGTR